MKKFFTEEGSIKLVYFGIGLIFFGIVLFSWNELENINNDKIDSTKVAQFGDFIGGVVGSLWALAGFILFYVALNKQKEDLELNRKALTTQIASMNLQTEEFKAQVQELEETRKVYIEQNKTQVLQRFENTFFSMLSLHHQIVEGIDLDYKEFLITDSYYNNFLIENNSTLRLQTDTYKARDVFKKTYQHLFYLIKSDYVFNLRENRTKTDFLDMSDKFHVKYYDFFNLPFIKSENNFSSIYLFIYEKVNTDLGHYFRNLYRLIRMIDEQEFDTNSLEKDFQKKYYYTSIVRSQLSDYELLWLFFNCIFDYGLKFKPLVEKYAFFKILDSNEDGVITHYKKLYSPSAFKINNSL